MLISKFDTESIEEKVAKFENSYEIRLPEQYKSFLYRYNGGRTPKTNFKIGRESFDLRAFYGLGDVKYSFSDLDDLEIWLKKKLLPIACDSFGNKIVISLDEGTQGRIFFCDHEKSYKTTACTENLKEFIKICKSKKIGSVWTIEEREQHVIACGNGHIIDDELKSMWQEEIDLYSGIVQETAVIE